MNRLEEEFKVNFRDHDPNASDTLTNAGFSTAWLDMFNFDEVQFVAFRTVGTGVVQDSAIFTSASSTGSNAVLVRSLGGSTNATGSLVDATAGKTGTTGVGLVVHTATYDDIQKALEGGRFVCLRMSLATGTDEFGIVSTRRLRERAADQLVSGNG